MNLIGYHQCTVIYCDILYLMWRWTSLGQPNKFRKYVMRLFMMIAIIHKFSQMRLYAYTSPTLLLMGLIFLHMISIMLISQHHAMRSIGPYVALNLDWNMRVRRLLLFETSRDFPAQERTSETFSVIVWIILDVLPSYNETWGFLTTGVPHLWLIETTSELKTSFYPTYTVIDKDSYEVQSWRHVYGNVLSGCRLMH